MQIFTEGSDEVPRDYLKAMQHFEMAADQVRGLRPYSGLALFRCTFCMCDTRIMEMAIAD
jgi:TPR repeat protein